MILSFDTEIAELLDALAVDPSTATSRQRLRVAMILAGVLDRGMGAERRRCLGIVSRKAMNAAAVRAEMERPLR